MTFRVLLEILRRLVFVLPLACATFAAYDVYTKRDTQKSAPQQAALAGYVLAWTVIPYCFARAFSEIVAPPSR